MTQKIRKNKSLNLIISTYPASIRSAIGSKNLLNQEIKTNNYLKNCITKINLLHKNFDKISIPRILPNSKDIKRYGMNTYNNFFKEYYDLSSIKHLPIYQKIEFIDMTNHGNSYYQFLRVLKKNEKKYNFFFFLEDDYIIKNSIFIRQSLNFFQKMNRDYFITCGVKSFNYELNVETLEYHKNLFSYDIDSNIAHGEHAAHSIGIINSNCIKKLKRTKIFQKIYNENVEGSVAQTLFSYMFINAKIEIIDLKEKVHNIFWETYYYTMVSFGKSKIEPSIVPIQYYMKNINIIHITYYDFFINVIPLLNRISILNNLKKEIADQNKNLINKEIELKKINFTMSMKVKFFFNVIYSIILNKKLYNSFSSKKSKNTFSKETSRWLIIYDYIKFLLFYLNPISVFKYLFLKIFSILKLSFWNINTFLTTFDSSILNLVKDIQKFDNYSYYIILYSTEKSLKSKYKKNIILNFLKNLKYFDNVLKRLNLENVFVFDLNSLPLESDLKKFLTFKF